MLDKQTDTASSSRNWQTALLLFASILLFFISLDLVSKSFTFIGRDIVHELINATANPFIGLFIGILSTAILQSSSTTTSMTVALVGSNTLPLESAVPIVMGANIGTTVTSTFVSLSYLYNKNEFRKALAAATLHDFFNLFVVLILFPVEYYTHLLSRTCYSLSNDFTFSHKIFEYTSFKEELNFISETIIEITNHNPYILLPACLILVFVPLRILSKTMKNKIIGTRKKTIESYLFQTSFKSLSWGILLTSLLQSSSITTSLAVPLVADQRISLKKIFPFIMGANVGTTITALLAAVTQSEAALSLALCHFIFNIVGVLLFYPIPIMRKIPIIFAEYVSRFTYKSRFFGFAYMMIIFFIIPYLLIFVSKHF